MKRRLVETMGYREQKIRCCALCRFATYSKTGCTKAPMLDAGQIGNAAVSPTGVCGYFEIRDAGQDEAIEGGEWQP